MKNWAGLLVLLFTSVSSPAQSEEVPFDRSIDVQLFEPAVGPHSFLTVSGAQVTAPKQFSLGLLLTYLTHPFTVYNVNQKMDDITTTRTQVVKSLLSGQLVGSYGLTDKTHLGMVLPVVLSMQGDGLDPETAQGAPGGLSVTGIGDAKLELAWLFFRQNGLLLAAVPAITVPTSTGLGSANAWLGDDLPSLRPRVAAEWNAVEGKVTAGANLGVILRKPRELYSSEIGQQVTYGAALAYHVNRKVDVLAELFGRQGFSSDVDESPLEIDGALKISASPALAFLAGGGTGIVRGIGSPDMRVFAALTWSPDYGDSDGDGIVNMKDRCPLAPEDKDEWMDGDGCPDSDNDGDLIGDDEDKCPSEAEDKDGWEDDDGCPEPDNDKDGFKDEIDRCPGHAEDKLPPLADDGCPASMRDSDDDGISDDKDKCRNDQEDMDGFQDDDGCPEVDNDSDGVPDEFDECPLEAEDTDKFEDENGCPEADNDHDGLLDAEDQCPGEAEVINGVNDFDGCPDQGGAALVSMDGDKLLLLEKLKFSSSDSLRSRSKEILDQATVTMRAQGNVSKWRVVVAAEDQGSERKTRAVSQARADAIKAYLSARGVAADKIEAIGAVADEPAVVIVATERAGK
ncbi:MAG: OmpA family protein [Deltaproteobacteria bacterium]|nr:OmpA family protein [Deltaproteobacteria bacterium]